MADGSISTGGGGGGGATNLSTTQTSTNRQIINLDAYNYIYDIELIKADGTVKTYISGNFSITNDVTR